MPVGVNAYLPLLASDAFGPMPDTAEPLAGSPRELVLPWDFERLDVPGWQGESELVWRYLVAMRHHGEWAALRYSPLVADLLIEAARTDNTRKVKFGQLELQRLR